MVNRAVCIIILFLMESIEINITYLNIFRHFALLKLLLLYKHGKFFFSTNVQLKNNEWFLFYDIIEKIFPINVNSYLLFVSGASKDYEESFNILIIVSRFRLLLNNIKVLKECKV